MPRPTRTPGGLRDHTPNAREEEREDIDSDEESGEDGSRQERKAVNPRDAIFDRMDERLTRLREREVAQSRGESLDEEEEEDEEEPQSSEDETQDTDDEGGTPDDAGAEEGEVPEPEPLDKFVVKQGGKSLFRIKVDGKEQLIPLETVQTQLQKHGAADIRLQQASQTLKSAQEQAEQIRQNAALAARAPAKEPPSNPDEDNELREEASNLAKALLTEPEDKVAETLAATLKKLRHPKTAPVNTQEIVTSVVKAVQKKTTEDRLQEDMARGLEAFERDFPEINADPNLYRVADGLTDAIAQEHPSWTPSQVMTEAGKQTRAWATKSGLKLPKTPALRPGTNDRQVRKQGLTPMPKAQSAKRTTPAKKQEDNSPRTALAEIKKSRGQAY
jgi:hypothetical protein